MRAAVLALALATFACGTTRIVAGDPAALIIVDGELAGRGSAELRKRGGPSQVDVEVRFPNGAVARRLLSRKFTGLTLVVGLFTYGIGFFTVWELPDEIAVPTPPADEDPWMRPPSGALSSSAW